MQANLLNHDEFVKLSDVLGGQYFLYGAAVYLKSESNEYYINLYSGKEEILNPNVLVIVVKGVCQNAHEVVKFKDLSIGSCFRLYIPGSESIRSDILMKYKAVTCYKNAICVAGNRVGMTVKFVVDNLVEVLPNVMFNEKAVDANGGLGKSEVPSHKLNVKELRNSQ